MEGAGADNQALKYLDPSFSVPMSPNLSHPKAGDWGEIFGKEKPMQIVYIVVHRVDYEGAEIEAVFEREGDAEALKDKRTKEFGSNDWYRYQVMEYVVQ